MEGPRTPVAQPNFQALVLSHSTPPPQRSSATNFFQTPQLPGPVVLSHSTPPPQWSSAINIFQTPRISGPLNSPQTLPMTPHSRPFYHAQSTPSPSHIQTNHYYQLISPQPIIYPQMPYPSPAWTPTIPYNQTPPGTIIYQTPAVPPSSLRFSYYNPQTPR